MQSRSRPLELDRPINHFVAPHWNMDGPDMFGVEIELEGISVQSESPSLAVYWKQIKDGSLRVKPGVKNAQAIEYIFRHPMVRSDANQALKLLFDHLTSNSVKVFDSYRTSTHIHINCMEETMRTVMNYITLAMIFDELFVSQNGQTRIGNNFCLRTRDAEGQISDLIHSVHNYGTPFQLGHNRYSSVNAASLGKFGTIEFRSLECTTDLKRVQHWIDTLQRLKVSARTYRDPRDVIAKFSQKGPLGFTLFNLGEFASKYTAIPGFADMLHTGMRLAQDFAYCSEWKTAEPGVAVKARSKSPKLGLAPNVLNEIYNIGPAPGPAPIQAVNPFAVNWDEYMHPVGAAGAPQPPPPAQWANVNFQDHWAAQAVVQAQVMDDGPMIAPPDGWDDDGDVPEDFDIHDDDDQEHDDADEF